MILTFFLKKIYYKLPKPENWKFWICISLIVKGLFFVYFIYLASFLPADYKGYNYNGSWAKAGGDTDVMYFAPIENFISQGLYYDDLKMPGYGFVYYLFRLVFDKTITANLIVIIQLIFSAISVYCLSLIAYKVFKSNSFFFFTYFLYLFSIFVSVNDYVLMTESLATSTLIISVYFYISFFENNKRSFLLYSGIFITWAIFLRPIIAPVLVIYVLFLAVNYFFNKNKIKSFIINTLLISLSFTIIDGIWIYRNYKTHKKFIPLQRSVYGFGVEKGYGGAMYDFIRAIGGDIEFWEPHSELIYFFPESRYFNSEKGNDTNMPLIPEYVYTSRFNRDTLIDLRRKIIKLYACSHNDKIRILIEKDLIFQINSLINSYKKEKPFHYYISSRMRSLSSFFILRENGLWGLIWLKGFKNYYCMRIFKAFFTFFYYYIIFTGLIGLFIHFFTWKISKLNILIILLALLSLYTIFINPIFLKLNPNRYLVIGFPFLIIYSAFTTQKLMMFLNKSKNL